MSILVEDRDAVRVITIDRPARKNALTAEMFEALCAAFEAASADDHVRVALLRGAGGQFTAGLDLEELRSPGASSRAPDGEHWSRRFLRVVAAFDKPLLAAVDRYALGVGCTALLLCDLVYAAAGTVFRAPFVPMGLVPEAASTALLPRLAGHAVASEILLFGEQFPTELANRAGIVNEVVAPEQVHERALARAATLSALPPESLVATKALLRRGTGAELAEVMDAEFAEFDKALARLTG
jgi:enoyl-CoA hydratase/carnithine racemase